MRISFLFEGKYYSIPEYSYPEKPTLLLIFNIINNWL
jgi:hypothetical protein